MIFKLKASFIGVALLYAGSVNTKEMEILCFCQWQFYLESLRVNHP